MCGCPHGQLLTVVRQTLALARLSGLRNRQRRSASHPSVKSVNAGVLSVITTIVTGLLAELA